MNNGFTARNQAIADVIMRIATEQHPLTGRAVYYQTVSTGLVERGAPGVKQVQRILTRLRETCQLKRNWIADNTRSTHKPASWDGLADFADTMRDMYRKDLWAQQDDYICFIIEKDAIAATILPVTREFDVSLHPTRGFVSIGYADEIARQWQMIRKPIYAYYLGDWDPSGLEMEMDLRLKLADYSGKVETAPQDVDASSFCLQRIAVLPEHFAKYNLIELSPPKKDRRSSKFVSAHGNRCAEVDAIPAPELRRIVRETIETHVDQFAWQALKRTEEIERVSLIDIANAVGDIGR